MHMDGMATRLGCVARICIHGLSLWVNYWYFPSMPIQTNNQLKTMGTWYSMATWTYIILYMSTYICSPSNSNNSHVLIHAWPRFMGWEVFPQHTYTGKQSNTAGGCKGCVDTSTTTTSKTCMGSVCELIIGISPACLYRKTVPHS